MVNVLKEILGSPKLIITYCRLYLIYRKTRFQVGSFRIFSKQFTYIDSASFVAMYRDIFINESYKFKTSYETPLIIDCGANIGLSVLYYKYLYPKAIIEAFEPDLKIFKILESNCKKFNLSNVNLINSGVWVSNGEVGFLADGSDGGKIAFNSSDESLEKVKMIRLKDLLQKKRKITFLKIDIEGAEVDVFRDCQNNFTNVDFLFVEYHSFVNREQELDELLKILKSAGFRYYINGVGNPKSPFLKRANDSGADLQLNIYAYRQKI